MAKKVYIDVVVDDKGTTKKMAVNAKKAEKALGGVAKGARTADRNLKGAAKASSNTTKNFSKMAQGAGGLVAVYATLAAQVFAISAAFQFLKESAQFSALIKGQEALGSVTGIAYKTITKSIQSATNAQLKYADAAKAAAIGTAAGLSPSQLERLAEAAKNVSIVLGRDLNDSFDRLIRGVTKAEPELLDELGIILRLDTATRKYALTLGKSAQSLNEFERSQAVANEVLFQAESKFGKMQDLIDPTTAALNQFTKAFNDIINQLRTMLSGPVAGIATFLSDNLYSLIAVVSLFGLSIAKSILPNMDAWRESSEKNIASTKKLMKGLNKDIAKSGVAWEKLSQTQAEALKNTEKSAKKILKSVPKGASGRQGATDFLRGDSDTKRAQNAANKALTNARRQLKDSTRVASGIYKDFTEKQIAGLEETYKTRTKLAKDFEKTSLISSKRIGLGFDIIKLKGKQAFSTVGLWASKAAKGVSVFMGALGRLVFWVGVLTTAWALGQAAWEYFFPPSEYIAKLNKETEELAEKYTLLAGEIERAADQRENFGRLSGTETIISIGNSAASLDIAALIQDINNLNPRADKFDELKEGLLRTAEAAARVDARFKGITESLRAGRDVTKDESERYLNLSNQLQAAGKNMEALGRLATTTDQELDKLVNRIRKPFGADFITAAFNEVDATAQGIKDLQAQIILTDNKIKDLNQTSKITISYERGPLGEYAPTVQERDYTRDQALISAASKKSIEGLEKENKLNREQIALLKQRNAFATATAYGFAYGGEDADVLAKKEARILLEAEKMKTRNLSLDEKIANVNAVIHASQVAATKEKKKLNLLRTEERGLVAKLQVSEAGVAAGSSLQLDLLRGLIKAAEDDAETAEHKAYLVRLVNEETLRTLDLAKAILEIDRKRLDLNKKLVQDSMALSRIQSGVSSFGIDKAQQEITQKGVILTDKLNLAKNDLLKTEEALVSARTSGTDTTIQAAEEANQQSELAVQALEQEIELYEKRGEIIMNSVRADREAAQVKRDNLALNEAEVYYNEKMLELKEAEVPVSQAMKEALWEEAQTRQLLLDQYELQEGAQKALLVGTTAAFTAIVTGSKSAKDALLQAAEGMLIAISALITKFLVLRAVAGVFGPAIMGGSYAGAGFTGAAVPAATSAGSKYIGGGLDLSSITSGFSASSGGVMSGPSSGYPGVLHGTEAVVPLPDNKSIPVDIQGGMGQQNNVTVNVSTEGQVDTQADSNAGANLGNVVARAVQKELQNQKRSGGMLNRYGVA